jgi:hypothetical protein
VKSGANVVRGILARCGAERHPVRKSDPAMSGRIDDPIDAAFDAFPDEPEGLGRKFAELALSLFGVVFPPATIAKILNDQFRQDNRFERIDCVLRAVSTGIKTIESNAGDDREKIKDIQARIDSPRFQEAVATACEEAARASSTTKVRRFAAALLGWVSPGEWVDPNADLGAIIRDLAQLGDQDIRVLEVLKAAFAPVLSNVPNLNDPNRFTERMQDYRTAISLAHIEPEDFYGTCIRLCGFGLAIEVLRSSSRMHLHEYCYRPTRRGLSLLDSLERFGAGGL